jgi:imidazolonepropionase-like amidohydrolase
VAAYAAAKISIVKARELGVKMAMGSDASHRFPSCARWGARARVLPGTGLAGAGGHYGGHQDRRRGNQSGDTLGTLTPGKVADILVVEGPVSEDVRVLRDKRNIKWMYQAGREVALHQTA